MQCGVACDQISNNFCYCNRGCFCFLLSELQHIGGYFLVIPQPVEPVFCSDVMACKFNESWLGETDVNGHLIKTWAKPCASDDKFVTCCACEKRFCISRGKFAINQHAKGSHHQQQYNIKFKQGQTRLDDHRTGSAFISPRQEATKAELLWTMRLISKNHSFESVEGLKELLLIMFPNAEWLQYFSLGPRKLSYMVTYALAPFFLESMVKDISGKSKVFLLSQELILSECSFFLGYYSIMYDETTNFSSQKELQFRLIFWSETKNEVNTRHLETCFIQHARAEDIVKKIHEVINNSKLKFKNLISLASDGPYVNKKVFRIINTDMLNSQNRGLVDIGTCNLHIVNNAFLKGLDELGSIISDLSVSLKYFFKDRPSRWSDYEYCQKKVKVPKHGLVNHVPSRWLTLGAAAERLFEQWPAIEEYFLRYIPREQKNILTTKTYKTIKEIISKKTIKGELKFVINSSKMFSNFVNKFQSNEPLIHVIHDEVKSLLVNISIRFCQVKTCENIKNDLYDDDTLSVNNLLPLEDYRSILGQEISDILEKDAKDKTEIPIFTHKARKHYKACFEYIVKRIPVFQEDSLFKATRSINPKLIKESNTTDILKLSKYVPNFTKFTDLEDEWKVLKLEVDNFSHLVEKKRCDHFWREIFDLKSSSGNEKFPTLKLVIQTILCLSHGNAEVERGFSRSMRILTKDRNSLGEKCFNAILTVADALKTVYNNRVDLVPISKELCTLAKTAHSAYEDYLSAKKREEERRTNDEKRRLENEKIRQEELKHKDIENEQIIQLEKKLKDIKKQETNKVKAASELLQDANQKLTKALKNNNITQANVAHALIQGAQMMINEETNLLQEEGKLQQHVNKRKSDLLLYFTKKRKNNE